MSSWMIFLNASLLFGAAAFAIPLIIHLLNRSRFKSLDWGAMMFLEDALRANSRRLEWQKWLLLLLRCAIPICLALCMARPLLQNSSMTPMLAGSQTSATCLLIDNSLSMEAKIDGAGEGAKTALDKAKRFALEAIQSAPRNSRWSIHPIGASESDATGIVSRDVKRQTALIDQMPQGAGGADFLATIDGAIEKLAKTSESQRRILVVSDFQKTMCQKIEPTQVTTLRQRYATMPNPPSIVFLTLNAKDAVKQTQDNLNIQIDAQTQSLVGAGQPWEIRLVVKNFGNEIASNVKLILSVDGAPTSAKSFDVPSRAETQVTFGMIFPEAGSHRVEAALERNDSLIADNNATWSVLVMGTIPVLVVDPTLYDRKRTPESEFLQAALDPFADSPERHTSLFRVSKISPEELKPDKLSGHKIIALANVSQLNDAVVGPLMKHIDAGGILLIFSGDRIDPSWYNKHLATMLRKTTSEATSDSKQLFLPMLFDRQPTLLNREATGMKLRRENFQHPTVQFLNDTRTGTLDNIEVQGWYRLLPNADADQDSVAKLVSLVNGDLLIAERAVGEGSVLQIATTCNDSWTNWPLRPVYLPMLHQLLLKSTPPSRWPVNVATNQQLNFPTPQVLDWIADTASESSVARMRNRGSDSSKLAASEDDSKSPVWHFPNAVQSVTTSIMASYPGIYRIEDMAESPLYLSAQAPLEESDLEAESEEGLKLLAERLGAQVVRSPDELISLDRRGSQELWRWFLIVLLALLFGELFLQRRFSGAAA